MDRFLAFRCSKEFLTLYVSHHPETCRRVARPGQFLNAVSEVDLAIRLHEANLLPEEQRRSFVETVISYAMRGDDLYAIESSRIQKLFTENELSDFFGRVRDELLSRLGDLRRRWQLRWSSDEPPEECIEPLMEAFKALRERFAYDPEIVRDIDDEIEQAEEWILEHSEEDRDEPRSRKFGDVEGKTQPTGANRDLFDDVDE
jgi:hypothetical protein